MTTSVARIAIFSLLFSQIPLAGEVFAQSETATTTTSIEEEQALASVEWYTSERISGQIEVGDFVVGPGRTEIQVAPGDIIVREITVTNRISPDREFKLEVEDITGSIDGSSAVSLTGQQRGPYSIRDYISFPEDTITLDLGERARVPVTITIPPDAEPGGFYGSVLVSTVRKGSADDEAPRSPIIARIGSLFFVTVEGATIREGETKEIRTINNGQWWYEKGPIDFGIAYENTGSVHLNPYGELSIKNMFGEEVGFVELEPWFILPQSLRVREISWDREFLFGFYTVEAKVNRGYDDVIDEVATSFWVLPWKIVGGVFIILFVVIFSIRAFFRTFEFKRKDS